MSAIACCMPSLPALRLLAQGPASPGHTRRKNPDNYFLISQTGSRASSDSTPNLHEAAVRPPPRAGYPHKPDDLSPLHGLSRAHCAPVTPGSSMMMSNSTSGTSSRSPAIMTAGNCFPRGPGEICHRGPQAHQHCCRGDVGHRAGRFCCGCAGRSWASFGRSPPCRIACGTASCPDRARAPAGPASSAGRGRGADCGPASGGLR